MLGLRSQRAVRPPATVPLKVFISYSRKEEVIADRIVGALVRRGIDVMIDRSDLAAGDDWKHELMKMIQAADTVVWLERFPILRGHIQQRQSSFGIRPG